MLGRHTVREVGGIPGPLSSPFLWKANVNSDVHELFFYSVQVASVTTRVEETVDEDRKDEKSFCVTCTEASGILVSKNERG